MGKPAKQKRNLPKEASSFKSEAVILEPLQVKIDNTRGDYTRLVKKFIKKVRNEEVLKPYYDKMAYFISKSEKKRAKRRTAKFEEQKRNCQGLDRTR